MRRFGILGLMILGLGWTLSPTVSQAISTGVCDSDAPGNCTQSVSLSANTLSITFNNTSPLANGGFITAVAFDLAGGATITSFNSTNGNFGLAPGLNVTGGGIQTSPFPDHEFVITLSPGASQPFLGAGSPNGGIPAGGAATFTLALGGSFGGVTEGNLISSEVIRFKGFIGGGEDSDKDPIGNAIPEPSTIILLASGLVGFAAFRRKGLAQRK